MSDTEKDEIRMANIIRKFYSSFKINRNQFCEKIRQLLGRLLIKKSNFNFLEQQVGTFTLRGLLWCILIPVNSTNEFDLIKYTANLSNESIKLLDSELNRLDQTNRFKVNKNTREFLMFFAGWQQDYNGQSFEQSTYLFAILFLNNMPLTTSCFAFKQFFEIHIPQWKATAVDHQRTLSRMVIDIINKIDPELGGFITEPPESFCFSHIASLLTQMHPMKSVERFYDFIFAFGPHLTIFIEIGWILFNRENIQNKKRISDCTKFPVDLPDEVLRSGIKIYSQTDEETINEIRSHFYS